MRLLVLALAAILPAASAPAQQPASAVTPIDPQSPLAANPLIGTEARKCRRPDFRQVQRSAPGEFRRLDQLPDATAYMAVYRTIAGCEEPMTVTEYRTGRR